MSTLEGHSERQPLQARQESSIRCSSGLPKSDDFASNPFVRTSRMTLALARVENSSSPVTLKAGHIVPPMRLDFRQAPAPLHCSTEHMSAWACDRTPLAPSTRHSSKAARQL